MKHALRVAAFAASALWSLSLALPAAAQVTPQAGDLIKLQDDGNLATTNDAALYYLGADNKRYVFPNEKTYFTWYSDFAAVKIVTPEQMASYAIGGNVTYRPGVRMVKIQTDPKTYAVMKNGILRWVKTEALAEGLYGSNWATKIDDVSDAFFSDYHVGAPIENGADLYTAAGAMSYSPSINVDKLLLLTSTADNTIDLRANGFEAATKTVAPGATVVWINISSADARIKSPTDLPALDSGTLGLGQEYKFTFATQGTFGYRNELNQTQTGTVTVTGQ